MKKFIMKYLMANCKEATYLMAKKEEGKLSFRENMRLSLHTAACSICKLFENQTLKISRESKFIHGNNSLSDIAKERIRKMMSDRTR